ncbi:MAG: hypothetical protein LUF92_15200 [Clostridiales bacterium]|nr:hypothetical protein [Clostridiales bacterium]
MRVSFLLGKIEIEDISIFKNFRYYLHNVREEKMKKRNMKKIICMFLVFAMAMSVIQVRAFENIGDSNKIDDFSADKEYQTSENLLDGQCVTGIRSWGKTLSFESYIDCISKVEGKTTSKNRNYENGIRREIKDYFVKEVDNGKDTEEYHEMTVTYTIPGTIFMEDKSYSSDIFTLNVYASSGSNTKTDSDSTGTVRCSSMVSYTISTTNGKEYIQLTKTTVKLISLTGNSGTSQGSGISIVSNEATVGCYGIKTDGTYYSKSKTKTLENKPCSWTYSPSWSKVGYSSGTNIYKIGTNHVVKLKRGNSTWTISLSNNIK